MHQSIQKVQYMTRYRGKGEDGVKTDVFPLHFWS